MRELEQEQEEAKTILEELLQFFEVQELVARDYYLEYKYFQEQAIQVVVVLVFLLVFFHLPFSPL